MDKHGAGHHLTTSEYAKLSESYKEPRLAEENIQASDCIVLDACIRTTTRVAWEQVLTTVLQAICQTCVAVCREVWTLRIHRNLKGHQDPQEMLRQLHQLRLQDQSYLRQSTQLFTGTTQLCLASFACLVQLLQSLGTISSRENMACPFFQVILHLLLAKQQQSTIRSAFLYPWQHSHTALCLCSAFILSAAGHGTQLLPQHTIHQVARTVSLDDKQHDQEHS